MFYIVLRTDFFNPFIGPRNIFFVIWNVYFLARDDLFSLVNKLNFFSQGIFCFYLRNGFFGAKEFIVLNKKESFWVNSFHSLKSRKKLGWLHFSWLKLSTWTEKFDMILVWLDGIWTNWWIFELDVLDILSKF